jgi:hypothetical protein
MSGDLVLVLHERPEQDQHLLLPNHHLKEASMKINILVITILTSPFGLGGLGGCASSNEPEVLPGIPADARLIDLDESQQQTLCEFTEGVIGGPEMRMFCTGGFEFSTNSRVVCVSDLATLPERRPDCPTLVRSEVNFWTNIRDNCDSPDFDPSNFEGQRACAGP